jgi:AcrR family transcriptional regulator
MQAAAARAPDLETQLVEIAVAMFDFVRKRRELTRLAFATAFAAPEELPEEVRDSRKRQRILDSFEQLMTRALKAGTLSRQFDARELAEGVYAAITLQVMRSLLEAQPAPTRRKAERMVRLFLQGAGLD